MLVLNDIGLKRENWVLQNIDLRVESGEILGIIGKSGVGKTSLLKIIAGMLSPSTGEVFYDDKKIFGPEIKLIPGYDDIQLVNQDFGLDPFHTVEQNIKEKILSRHANDRDELVNEFLALVELDFIRNRKAVTLSGGEQQRLAIAMALACEPDVLLLDEPFVHLDQRIRLNIIHYLLKLNELRRTTIVLVSHDGAEMMGFVNKIVHLDQRKIQRQDTALNMYYRPDNLEQGQLLGPINQITIDDRKELFRPNEYELSVDDKGISLKYIHSIHAGLTVFNYFETKRKEQIMLVSIEPLSNVRVITLKHKL